MTIKIYVVNMCDVQMCSPLCYVSVHILRHRHRSSVAGGGIVGSSSSRSKISVDAISRVLVFQSENKIDHHCEQQEEAQHSRPHPVIVWTGPTSSDRGSAPVIRYKRVHHAAHGNECEQSRTNTADAVAEIQQSDSEPAKHDREVKPR